MVEYICVMGFFMDLDVFEMMVCGWYVEGFVVCFDYCMVVYIGFLLIVCWLVFGVVVFLVKCCVLKSSYGDVDVEVWMFGVFGDREISDKNFCKCV